MRPFLLALLSIPAAHAAVLTFDISGLVNFDDISVDYGDNIGTLVDGTFSYGLGNGFTPNISANYRTALISDDSTSSDHLDWWSTGYGDLTNVAYCVEGSCTDRYAEITLVADPGFFVALNSFDLAGYNFVDHPNSTVRILVDGLLVTDFFGTIAGTGGTHTAFSPGLSGQTITIRFGFNDWNVGIDNIDFDQQSSNAPVPEPSTVFLTAVGVAAVALRRFRK